MRARLVALLSVLILTQGVAENMLPELNGNDWLSWSKERQDYFVAGYLLGLLVIEESYWAEDLPAGWGDILYVRVSVIVRETTAFYKESGRLDYPLYKAIMIRRVWRQLWQQN